ncbi:hypothetical protein ELI24_16910 [Rhizobium ruizarguesonis]|uniref:hypothetical protein n=1 Tax=Rhizobium ruizarguesonis TaxID=2081791 RepID=UPI001031057D|nr:hypothetical protein [Rhizobium ruizarguesonis]TAV99941.1 hypothetical protein ELI24_16910 [Rhizobium ruizarguesonis]
MSTKTFDLSQFSKSIKEVAAAKNLVLPIEECIGARSQAQDLRTVDLYLSEILRIDGGDVEHAGVWGGSLFMSAVVMYARGVDTTGTRKRVDVVSALNQDLNKKHRHILSVRDKVMAHFVGRASSGGFKWIDEIGYIRETDGQPPTRTALAFKRANYLAREVNELQELLAVVWPFVQAEIEKRDEAMLAMLKHYRTNADIERKLQASEVDLAGWLDAESGTIEGTFYVRVAS